MPLLSWYLVQILEPLLGLGHSTIAGHGVGSGVYNCRFYTAISHMVTMVRAMLTSKESECVVMRPISHSKQFQRLSRDI